jgi:dethiobiotin synthetase/adenosylmethionine--8-amino-7-oxononanoate aminotransferase
VKYLLQLKPLRVLTTSFWHCNWCRPLRFPGVLVGDGRLGGISTTIGAYESLHSRGYDIPAIVLVDAGLSNEIPLQQYLQHK